MRYINRYIALLCLCVMIALAVVKIYTPSMQQLLFNAVSDGDCEKVGRLIQQGADVKHRYYNDKYGGGETVLHMAARRGDLKLVNLLIASGAQPDARSNRLYTPLSVIATSDERAGQLDCAMRLLAAGADPNAADEDGNTAFSYSVRYGKVSLALAMLGKGADGNILNRIARNALHEACEIGDDTFRDELVAQLIKAGVSRVQQDVNGKTPKELCIERHLFTTVKLFDEK